MSLKDLKERVEKLEQTDKDRHEGILNGFLTVIFPALAGGLCIGLFLSVVSGVGLFAPLEQGSWECIEETTIGHYGVGFAECFVEDGVQYCPQDYWIEDVCVKEAWVRGID